MKQFGEPEPIGPQAPTPDGYSPDPFAPDPTIFPPAPAWLFPATMILLSIASLVVLFLLYAWWKSIQISKAERAARGETEWIDLSKLAKGGRWMDEADQPPASRSRSSHDGTNDDPDDPDDGLEKSGGGPRN